MSKFSIVQITKNSLATTLTFLVLSACSTNSIVPNEQNASPVNAGTQMKEVGTVSEVNSVVSSEDISSQFQVDKENNSIKKNNPESSASGTNQKKTPKKPLFDWPVWEARMTRGFLPKGTKKRRRPHKGIDLAAPRGSAVMSAHDGIVIYTGSGFKGYGKMVMIESNTDKGTGFATLYGHLDKIVVYEGRKIRQGEVLGALGNTGRSSGPHLHFEIRKLNGPIDPLPLLPAGEALTNDVDNGALEE